MTTAGAEKLPRNLIRRGGVLYVRLMLNGRDIWRTTGHTTIKSALRKADEIKVALRNEEDFGSKKQAPTFQAWADDYQETYSERKRAPWRDTQILAPARHEWRYTRLSAITRSHVVRYSNKRLGKVAPSTWNRERGTLQAVFERAVDDGLLDANPFRGLDREVVGPRIRVLGLGDEAKLRAVLTPRFSRWLTFMLGTGLRLGEARAVSIDSVDFKKEMIHVSAASAKGGRSRVVPLRPEVGAAIRAQQEEVGVLWPSNSQTFRKVLTAARTKAATPEISPHDLRHTFATRYLQGGGDIYVLSRILGHSSVKMTESFYVHLESDDLVERSRHVDLKMVV